MLEIIDDQEHFLWRILAPYSLYSYLLIHDYVWKVERQLNIDPPIHDKLILSEGANIFILFPLGARAWTSFDNR